MSDFRLNRVFSRPLTRALLKTPVTPNQVTFTSLLFGLLAGFLFSKGDYFHSLAGAGCYQLAVVLDNCDGEVARAKNRRSEFGGWLDIAADFLTDVALFTGVTLGVLRQGTPGPARVFLILCLSGASMHFLLVVMEKLKGFGPAVFNAPHPEHEKRRTIFLGIFDAFREGEASWLVLFLAVVGQTSFLLWAGGFYMQLLWISALVINFKWISGKPAK